MTTALPLLLVASLSRTTFIGIELIHEEGVTSGIFTVSGIQGDDRRFSRVTRDYDPSYMSVEFLGASHEVPAWGVDTLTGGNGWPRSLMVAIPGLEPGMEVTWSFRAEEFGLFAEKGLWFNWTGGPSPDSVFVSVGSDEGYSVHLDGFTEVSPGVFRSAPAAERAIWLASDADWPEIGRMVLGGALEALSTDPSPDLRDAMIQAGAAGASPEQFLSRARTLISDNLRITDPPGEAALRVRPVQQVLDTRYATPLEAAVLFCAMARLAGHDATLAAARADLPPIPYPIGWNRFLVSVETPEGTLWFEPSAPLCPAGFIEATTPLYILPEGGERPSQLDPEGGNRSYCSERWSIDQADGTFRLVLDCRGGFDMELRERIGGMPVGDELLALSEWFRSSGINLFPTECTHSNFFDLAAPATLALSGVMAPSTGTWCERTPRLEWRSTGDRVVFVNGTPDSGRVLVRSE